MSTNQPSPETYSTMLCSTFREKLEKMAIFTNVNKKCINNYTRYFRICIYLFYTTKKECDAYKNANFFDHIRKHAREHITKYPDDSAIYKVYTDTDAADTSYAKLKITSDDFHTAFNQTIKTAPDDETLNSRFKRFEEALQKVQIPDKEQENLRTTYEKFFNSNILNEGENSMQPNPQTEDISNLIRNGVKQIILTGAPGTGKSYCADRIALELVQESLESIKESKGLTDDLSLMGNYLSSKDKNTSADAEFSLVKNKYIHFVQFHPSYDYTDFVEGLRPICKGSDITFQKMDGIFKSFCRKVAENNLIDCRYKDIKYFFIIDEINRSDLSKVFGELMYCLETDKRGSNYAIKTQYQNLPTYVYRAPNKKSIKKSAENTSRDDYKLLENFNIYDFNHKALLDEKRNYLDNHDIYSSGFYIPENIYIIGTMNDIDRSVESMDFALRRRFMWKEFKVNKTLLENAFKNGNFHKTLQENAEDAAKQIMDLNLNGVSSERGKSMSLNEQYYISQGQFSNLPEEINSYDFTKLYTEDSSDRKGLLNFVWDTRLESLLRDYVRGESSETIDKFINEDCKNSLFSKQNSSTDKTDEEQAHDNSQN